MTGTYGWRARGRALLLVGALIVLHPATATAQRSDTVAVCNGRLVRTVEVNAERPQFRGLLAWWRKFARALGLHHETTASGLIRRFVTLEPGRACTEFRRSETERILRAQPYLADASVTTTGADDGVRVHVTTVDEVPVVVGARVAGREVRAFNLGTMNFAGAGVHVEGRWEREPERRHGFGGKLAHPQLLGRPYALVLEGMRRSLGEHFTTTLSHPFYTDLQRIAWHSGYSVHKDFVSLREGDQRQLLQPVDRSMWNVGGVLRIGPPRKLLLVGGMILGERVVPRHEFLLVDSAGPRLSPIPPPPGARQYETYDAVHMAGVLGVRALTFHRMAGLDALVAEQDVGTGIQVGGAYGMKPGIQNPFEDAFMSLDAYVGKRTGRSFLGARVEAETRIDMPREFEHIIASGRGAWYWQPMDRWTSELSVEGTGGWNTIFPFQLELGDRRGGLRGHARSHEAGGHRLLARLEERFDMARFRGSRAAFGFALFSEAGKVWAGDVPFGVTTPVRTSVGAAILSAVPARSQRTIRAELAVPVTRGAGARPELRFTVREPARGFWSDPPRIRWARLSALPEQIFTWP